MLEHASHRNQRYPPFRFVLLRMIVFRKSKVRIQRKIMRKRAQTIARVNS